MGCGRSTMGSDSPSRNSKQDEDWNEGSDTPTSQKDPPLPSASANSHQTLPFNHGGALLAQAKISGSQLDFFKVLDEKIDSGPDYESDAEEDNLLKKSRLTLYLEQWHQLTGKSPKESQSPTKEDNIPLIRPPTDPSLSNSTLENECSSSTDDEAAASDHKESVKEQYMFMGNLYTLTRFRSDGSYIPRVDISPAHKLADNDEDGSEDKKEATDSVDTIFSVGCASSDLMTREPEGAVSPRSPQRSPHVVRVAKSDECATQKVNGTFPKSAEKVRKLERADTPYHHTITRKEHIPQRPASLVLRTVFPKQEEAS